MRFIKTLAAVALCTVMMAGPSTATQGDSKDDSEPFSITLITSKSQFKNNIVEVVKIKPEIKPGNSREQDTIEHQLANDADMAREAEAKKKIAIVREVSPAKAYDPEAKVIMPDTDYRDAKGRSNCVAFATKYTGIYKRLGYGVTIASEGNTPEVGAIALDRYRGHAAVVVAINGPTITLWDSNWIKGFVTERKVDISSQRGYIYR